MPAHAEAPARSVVPTLRLLPTPRAEPPYDDELGPGGQLTAHHRSTGNMQGTLALAFAPDPEPQRPPVPALRLVVPGPDAAPGAADDDAGTRLDDDLGLAVRVALVTPRELLTDPQRLARALAQGVAEALQGFRPVAQLARQLTPTVQAEVLRAVGGIGPAGPRPVVTSVRISEPAPGAAELSATVRHGSRWRAMAMRLEGLDGRWQCTALVVG